MSNCVIRVDGLSKRYHLGARQLARTTLVETLTDALTSPFRRAAAVLQGRAAETSTEEIWALRNVSFEVEPGEALGIVGRNGAGKSTLLKILSRITEPTEGCVGIRGRVGSLLEVGTGFHGELTGRENIFLNGAILGMRRTEIMRKFDEIVAFAEIDRFLDTPVKHYSSGMYMRLAFAVAAHLDPEVMLVDEVLAVGDAGFQKKCLGKMSDVARAGRTVLFVSHNMAAVTQLTDRCLWLDGGAVREIGDTGAVTRRYLSAGLDDPLLRRPALDGFHRHATARTPIVISRIWVEGDDGIIPRIPMGNDVTIRIEITNAIEIRGALLTLSLRRTDGFVVTTLVSADEGFTLVASKGVHTATCVLRRPPFTPGDYLLVAGINQSSGTSAWDVIQDYPIFRVEDPLGETRTWAERPWGALHWRDVAWSLDS